MEGVVQLHAEAVESDDEPVVVNAEPAAPNSAADAAVAVAVPRRPDLVVRSFDERRQGKSKVTLPMDSFTSLLQR